LKKTIFSGRPIGTKQYFDGTGAGNWTSTAIEVQRFGVVIQLVSFQMILDVSHVSQLLHSNEYMII
jgi:hypothetical protein